MASVRPRGIAAFCGIVAATLAAVGACTVFNGLQVTVGPDGAVADGAADGGSDALPPVAYLSIAQGAAVCTLSAKCPLLSPSVLGSIGVPIDPDNFSLCMEWAAGPVPGTRQGYAIQRGVLACIAAATTCEAAGACTVFETIAAGDPRCDRAADAAAIFCADDASTKVDCTDKFVQHCDNGDYTPGATCNADDAGDSWCSVGPLGAACPMSPTCKATFQDYCGSDGLHFTFNCANVGDTCAEVDGGLQCGEACDTLSVTCNGNVVQSCDGAEVSPFDCAAMGGTCSSTDNEIYCARPADECTPRDPDINVCTGTSLSICLGGKKTVVDCASVSSGATCLPGVEPQTPHCG